MPLAANDDAEGKHATPASEAVRDAPTEDPAEQAVAMKRRMRVDDDRLGSKASTAGDRSPADGEASGRGSSSWALLAKTAAW